MGFGKQEPCMSACFGSGELPNEMYSSSSQRRIKTLGPKGPPTFTYLDVTFEMVAFFFHVARSAICVW